MTTSFAEKLVFFEKNVFDFDMSEVVETANRRNLASNPQCYNLERITSGTCWFVACYDYRGPTSCNSNYVCQCSDGYYTADGETCIPCPTERPTFTPTESPITSSPTFTPTESFITSSPTSMFTSSTEYCPNSPLPVCRRMCEKPQCPESQCAMRNSVCCGYTCKDPIQPKSLSFEEEYMGPWENLRVDGTSCDSYPGYAPIESEAECATAALSLNPDNVHGGSSALFWRSNGCISNNGLYSWFNDVPENGVESNIPNGDNIICRRTHDCYLERHDYWTSDYVKISWVENVQKCQELCRVDYKCWRFTYLTLKDAYGSTANFDCYLIYDNKDVAYTDLPGAISGPKVCDNLEYSNAGCLCESMYELNDASCSLSCPKGASVWGETASNGDICSRCNYITTINLQFTSGPTNSPVTPMPTFGPSWTPSDAPTSHPTSLSTETLIFEPSLSPASEPTKSPLTSIPTVGPTSAPSDAPTLHPNFSPSQIPSLNPISTPNPTSEPTEIPTLEPTLSSPSLPPSEVPTNLPTDLPTQPLRFDSPTVSPSDVPSTSPTNFPMERPSFNHPTITNSSEPSLAPLVDVVFMWDSTSAPSNGGAEANIKIISKDETPNMLIAFALVAGFMGCLCVVICMICWTRERRDTFDIANIADDNIIETITEEQSKQAVICHDIPETKSKHQIVWSSKKESNTDFPTPNAIDVYEGTTQESNGRTDRSSTSKGLPRPNIRRSAENNCENIHQARLEEFQDEALKTFTPSGVDEQKTTVFEGTTTQTTMTPFVSLRSIQSDEELEVFSPKQHHATEKNNIDEDKKMPTSPIPARRSSHKRDSNVSDVSEGLYNDKEGIDSTKTALP